MRVYRTFEDWEADQKTDLRTAEQRGITVGAPVMWRHRNNNVIMTERAVVIAVDENKLTLQVKDVETRTCSADVNEIVTNQFGHSSVAEASRRGYLANQMETDAAKSPVYTGDESQTTTSWLS